MSVLIASRVIGVAHVATHGQPASLPQKCLLKPARVISFPSYRYSGTDKANNRINQQRLNLRAYRVSAGFARLLMPNRDARCGRQRAAYWPCFKYITLLPTVTAISDKSRIWAFGQMRALKPKTVVRGLVPAPDGLEEPNPQEPHCSMHFQLVLVTWVSTQIAWESHNAGSLRHHFDQTCGFVARCRRWVDSRSLIDRRRGKPSSILARIPG